MEYPLNFKTILLFSPNLMSTRAIEPPIWCALMAKDGDRIVDMELQSVITIRPQDDILIVVMGSNPSASSTPKMLEANRLKRDLAVLCRLEEFTEDRRERNVFITGLHPMATGEADVPLPTPQELVKTKRARWDLLPMKKYLAHNWHCLHDIEHRDRYAVLYTSYGCPFDCSFCNIHTIYGGRKVYYRNPVDVANEVDYLVQNYGIKNLKLCDEIFTLNHKHVLAVCELIKKYHLNIWAYARVGTVTPVILKAMKRAGINWLAYGFESANENVLNGVAKAYEDIYETVKMTREAGIHIMGNFIFGLPDDTWITMEQTYQLAKKLQCEYVNFYCAMAYPGSKLYKGDDTDWAHYDQYSPMMKPMGNSKLTPQQVMDFRNHAFIRYFTDEHYLHMIEHKFGIMAREHIMQMVQ